MEELGLENLEREQEIKESDLEPEKNFGERERVREREIVFTRSYK